MKSATSDRQNLVSRENQTNNLGHRDRCSVAEMTTHRITHHGAQFFTTIRFGHDRVANRRSYETSVCRILLNIEDDFVHESATSKPSGPDMTLSARTSRQASIASRAFSRASARVALWLTQPGIAGHSTIHIPSSSRVIEVTNFINEIIGDTGVDRKPDSALWLPLSVY